MPAIAEEAKRATKMEVGDLALEVIGKTIRIYEITGGSKLKQLAYSDTLQGDRFLMFSAPSNEITRAKDFTIARLYKKPERARKIIARYFPKYASAGASVHLYYAGAGPRGRSGATGEGYFSVPLSGPAEHYEGQSTLWNYQQGALDEAARITGAQETVEVTLRLDTVHEKKQVKEALEQGFGKGIQAIGSPAGAKLNVRVLSTTKSGAIKLVRDLLKRGGVTVESIDEAKFDPAKYVGPKYKVGDRVQIVRRFGWKKGYKPVPIKPPVPGKVKQVDRNVFYPKGPPELTLEIDPEDYGRASPKVMPTKYHRIRVKSDEVEPLKSKGESVDERARGGLQGVYMIPHSGEQLAVVNRPGVEKVHRRLTGEYGKFNPRTHALVENYSRATDELEKPYRLTKRTIRTWKRVGDIADLKKIVDTRRAIKERFDPQAAQDYVKAIKDRKAKAYAREYLKAIQGIRQPPTPQEFRITTQMAREVEQGFKKLGAPLAASVERTDPTFEQVARIIRKAKGAGFTPKRVTLTEGPIQIGNYDFIFLIHHDEEDTYQVAHSVHDDPRLGYQELETGLPKKAAERMVHKLKSRWTRAKVRRFLVIGKGHKREFLPESNEEKNKRIKADVDGEVRDPKNKGLTLMQVLRAMFKGVDEETRQEARKFVDRMAQKHYAKQHYTKAEKARLKKINLRFRGEQVSIDAISLLHTPSGESLDEVKGWTPQWTTRPGPPWRLVDKDGNWFRERRKDGMWMEHMFKSSEEALAYVKTAKGRKAVAAFRRMLRRDTDEARAKVFVRKLKDEVNYRRAEEERPDERCANCAFVQLPDECKRVRGKIDQDFTCDLWKRGVSEELDEALSKKARSVFSALEQNPEGISADKLKHYGAAGDVANLPAFLKKFVKKGWVEQKGDLYLPTPAYYRAQGNAPWIPFAKAKALKNAVFSTVNWTRAGKSEVILYDKKGKQVARTHVTATEMKQLPGLPISWTELMWIERHGEPSPGVQMRMKEGLDEATLHGRIKALLKGEDVKVTTAMPGDPMKRIKVIVKRVDTARLRKKLEAKGFRVRTMGRDLSVSENLDEAAAQGKVQAALLNFVKQLPRGSESTLADAAKRQEFRGVHFKRLMAAAKALEKKGLIWYDGFSNIGPSR